MNGFRSIIRLACLGIGASMLSACQTDRVTTSDGWRMPPAPHAAPVTPATAKADRMVFTVGSKPDDTNNNGYPDQIKVSVALFSTEHPIAVQQEGTFVFTLFRQGQAFAPDAKPMGMWKRSDEAMAKAVTRTFAGPAYLFQLSLFEVGGDQLPLDRADIVCRFEPADGSTAVHCDGVRTIQIGRRVAEKSR